MSRKLYLVSTMFSAVLLACGQGAVAPPDITGAWEGDLSVAGMELQIMAEFSGGDGLHGTLDIPLQQARDLELTGISISGDSIRFSLPSNLGQGDFVGILNGDTMSGSYSQGGYLGSFNLVRTSVDVEVAGAAGEEVVITGDGCSLAGTLTLPEGEPPFPAVLLLSGSGLQDRDEYVFGFPVFGELAEILTARGIAVLRCDDRGTGGSTGSLESFSDSTLLYDSELMLDHLRGDGRLDAERIGILGHSEGSTTAFMLAEQRPDEVAFVVSMAGPSIDGYHLIPGQMEVILAMQGYPQEEIDAKLEAQTLIMDAVIAGDQVALIDSVMRAQIGQELEGLSHEELAMIGDIDAYTEQMVALSLSSMDGPWFRSFLNRDPAESIRSVLCPVLVLYGGLDTQVIAETNAGPMEEALSDNPDHEIVVLEDANHLFQQANTGDVQEYAVLEPVFIDGFSEILSGWVGVRVGLD